MYMDGYAHKFVYVCLGRKRLQGVIRQQHHVTVGGQGLLVRVDLYLDLDDLMAWEGL